MNKKEAVFNNDGSNADHVEEMLSLMLKSHNPYSETFKINPDGTLDQINRVDGSPVYLVGEETPEQFYQVVAEIQEKHPEYKFDLQTDPKGQWLKYAVSKTEQQN